MEIKSGYKQTEVGVIPEDWDVDIVKNIASITTGSKNTPDCIFQLKSIPAFQLTKHTT